MLNPFPIQFLSLLAYALLRIIIGAILIYLAGEHLRHRKEIGYSIEAPGVWLLAVVELAAGVMFILGFYTQIAALLTIVLSIVMILIGSPSLSHIPGKLFYLVLLGASLSLFITGAGAFAFDLPI